MIYHKMSEEEFLSLRRGDIVFTLSEGEWTIIEDSPRIVMKGNCEIYVLKFSVVKNNILTQHEMSFCPTNSFRLTSMALAQCFIKHKLKTILIHSEITGLL